MPLRFHRGSSATMKVVNSSTNLPASSRSTGKPSTLPPARSFDAVLDQLDEPADAQITAQQDMTTRLHQEAFRDAQLEGTGASNRDQTAQSAEDDQPAPTAAEDAARATMLPTQREIRPEATAEVTPRRILHVLDMEKILATVRTQTFSGNEAQATIQLSHSVLHGLSITLQTDARGRVSAEITATTEAAKRIVDAHARELHELLQGRGLDISSFSTRLAGADTGTSFGSSGDSSAFSTFSRPKTTDMAAEGVEVADATHPAALPGSEGIYTA